MDASFPTVLSASQPLDGLVDRLIEALHVEALVLADEARAYFDDAGRAERDRLAPIDRVLFSCESLKVTTRLMHVVGWLLGRRVSAGRAVRPLGETVDTDPALLGALPPTARQLIDASRDLLARVRRLEGSESEADPAPSPARALMGRLERAW